MELQDGLSLTLGGTTIALVAKEIFAWLRARRQKTEITPTPLPIDDHENIFSRLSANDKLTAKLEGILEGIREDLKAIKDKLFRRTR